MSKKANDINANNNNNFKRQQQEGQQQGHEAQQRQAPRKTQMCKNISKPRGCPFGARCTFAHHPSELVQQQQREEKELPTNYRTSMCENFTRNGVCRFGNRCNFAHSRDQLRTLPGVATLPAAAGAPVGAAAGGAAGATVRIFDVELQRNKGATSKCFNLYDGQGQGCTKGNECGFAHSLLELVPSLQIKEACENRDRDFMLSDDSPLHILCDLFEENKTFVHNYEKVTSTSPSQFFTQIQYPGYIESITGFTQDARHLMKYIATTPCEDYINASAKRLLGLTSDGCKQGDRCFKYHPTHENTKFCLDFFHTGKCNCTILPPDERKRLWIELRNLLDDPSHVPKRAEEIANKFARAVALNLIHLSPLHDDTVIDTHEDVQDVIGVIPQRERTIQVKAFVRRTPGSIVLNALYKRYIVDEHEATIAEIVNNTPFEPSSEEDPHGHLVAEISEEDLEMMSKEDYSSQKYVQTLMAFCDTHTGIPITRVFNLIGMVESYNKDSLPFDDAFDQFFTELKISLEQYFRHTDYIPVWNKVLKSNMFKELTFDDFVARKDKNELVKYIELSRANPEMYSDYDDFHQKGCGIIADKDGDFHLQTSSGIKGMITRLVTQECARLFPNLYNSVEADAVPDLADPAEVALVRKKLKAYFKNKQVLSAKVSVDDYLEFSHHVQAYLQYFNTDPQPMTLREYASAPVQEVEEVKEVVKKQREKKQPMPKKEEEVEVKEKELGLDTAMFEIDVDRKDQEYDLILTTNLPKRPIMQALRVCHKGRGFRALKIEKDGDYIIITVFEKKLGKKSFSIAWFAEVIHSLSGAGQPLEDLDLTTIQVRHDPDETFTEALTQLINAASAKAADESESEDEDEDEEFAGFFQRSNAKVTDESESEDEDDEFVGFFQMSKSKPKQQAPPQQKQTQQQAPPQQETRKEKKERLERERLEIKQVKKAAKEERKANEERKQSDIIAARVVKQDKERAAKEVRALAEEARREAAEERKGKKQKKGSMRKGAKRGRDMNLN